MHRCTRAHIHTHTQHWYVNALALYIFLQFILQNLVVTLERSRSTMAEELAKLASANEDLKLQAESVAPLKRRLLVSCWLSLSFHSLYL